jgi:hypothetical protein
MWVRRESMPPYVRRIAQKKPGVETPGLIAFEI